MAMAGILIGLGTLFSVGCAGAGGADRPDLRQEGAALFGGSGGASGGSSAEGAGREGGWTIVLGTFTGYQAREQAEAALEYVRRDAGLSGAYTEHRENGSVVAYGAYENPASSGARRDLDRLRAMTVDGRQIFSQAFPAPRRMGGAAGSIPELDLSRAREMFSGRGTFTLQVGVYEGASRAETRRRAEEAAMTLRGDGEEAFYYHGPTRSMVTIGIFSMDDYDSETGEMSPRLLELQRRHPNNLYNGRAIMERVSGRRGENVERLQPSALVQIP